MTVMAEPEVREVGFASVPMRGIEPYFEATDMQDVYHQSRHINTAGSQSITGNL